MGKQLKIMFIFFFLITLSACGSKGENIWVYQRQNGTGLHKINAITFFTNNVTDIKAIVDVYNQENHYEHTILLHITGEKKDFTTTIIDGEPLTLYTEREHNNFQQKSLTHEQYTQVKENILTVFKKDFTKKDSVKH